MTQELDGRTEKSAYTKHPEKVKTDDISDVQQKDFPPEDFTVRNTKGDLISTEQ